MEIVLDNRQDVAVERMCANKRYCLFWDPGVGKTYPVLARLAKFPKRMTVLILAPAVSIEGMWKKQEEDDWFGVFEQHDIEMHGFEWFSWNKKEEYMGNDGKVKQKIVAENRTKLNHNRYDVVIIDEAHRLATSARRSRGARLISRLTDTAEYVYCLTGTPARNGYQDLYPLFKNAGIRPWGEFNYDEFLHYYFRGFDMHLPFGTVFKPTDIKTQHVDEFFNSIAPYCMFAQKERNGYTMDDPVDIDIPATKTPAYFDALKGIYADINGDKQTTNQLVGFSKAYMALNGFQYVMDADGNNRTVELFPNPKLPYLLKLALKELTQNNCVIVVYQFKRDYNNLSLAFANMGITTVDNLEDAHKQTGKFIYLLQLKKGISIDLQDLACVMIFYTYNFSYVDYDQTICRIDRRGQTHTVKIYRLMFPRTIERDIIIKALETKQRIDYTLKTKSAQRFIGKEVSDYGHK